MTPEIKNFLKECADIAKRFSALYESDLGLCSIDSTGEGPRVHLMEDRFLSFFDSFEVVDRYDSEFPWKLIHVENGVTFFCLAERNPNG